MECFRKWFFVCFLFVIGFILLFTGGVGFFTESFQIVIKKTFLLTLWYGVTYLIRFFRVGRIDWRALDPRFRVYYYFVLLIGSALIIAWG